MTEAHSPETSLVVRAFNEERWLPETLTAISGQRYQDFEVILVDSGSVDRTREIAASVGARVVRLRSEDFTFGHALNVGAQAARGRFIAIISAHAIPTNEDWLERLVAPLRHEDTAMVYGGQRGHRVSKFGEARDFERIFGSIPKQLVPPNYFANNANSAVRRDLWERRGFDEGLPGLEDIDWAKYWMNNGHIVLYEPKACVYHVHEETWPQVRRRYHREGIAARWVGIRRARDIPAEIWRVRRRPVGRGAPRADHLACRRGDPIQVRKDGWICRGGSGWEEHHEPGEAHRNVFREELSGRRDPKATRGIVGTTVGSKPQAGRDPGPRRIPRHLCDRSRDPGRNTRLLQVRIGEIPHRPRT